MTLTFIDFVKNSFKMSNLIIQDLATKKLDNLGPVLEAEPIKFSFNSPGWYFLGLTGLLILLFILIRALKKYKKNHYRREAIKSLGQLKINKPEYTSDSAVKDVLITLKKVALQTYGRKEVASLYGISWLSFLDSKAKNISFSKFQPIISKVTYEGKSIGVKDLNELMNLSKKWIRNHA